MNAHRRHTAALRLIVLLALAFFFLAPAHKAQAWVNIFTVNTTADHDDGSCDEIDCTLAEAINAANSSTNGASPDEIHFNITTGCDALTGVCTIWDTQGLPWISDPVVIDGYTQPGASPNTLAAGSNARLLIELNGTNIPVLSRGVVIGTSGSTVRGLIIRGYSDVGYTEYGLDEEEGIYIAGSDSTGNVIEGCYITSNYYGIEIDGAPGNTIGGTTPAARNIISGNLDFGIFLTGWSAGAQNSTVQGNIIGLNFSGTTGSGNGGTGIYIENAPGSLIGGTAPGAGNVISANGYYGIIAQSGIPAGATIQGNFIGTDVTGTTPLGNGEHGIWIDHATNNLIGGSVPGARNLISGNQAYGVYISGSISSANIVQGNYIGTDITGTVSMNNWSDGISIENAPGTLIGGTAPGAGNLISGNNGNGININGSYAKNTTIWGNRIGTDAGGTASLGNWGAGIYINNSSGSVIGGVVDGTRNIISGNVAAGIYLQGTQAGAVNTLIQGNYIGTDFTGTKALGNSQGITLFDAANSTIGGTDPDARNFISGNQMGIYLQGASSTGNIIQGNYIGSDVTGMDGLRSGTGIFISGAVNNTIGGTATGAGNLISGNDTENILIKYGAAGNKVQGNLIGTDITGKAMLANSAGRGTIRGIWIDGAPNNLIGGADPGARNVISGGADMGIHISGSAASGNTVQGNFIGTDSTGTASLPNFYGIVIDGAPNNRIGGETPGARNVISGNAAAGIAIIKAGATGNLVAGNYIGTDLTGTQKLGNGTGVDIELASGSAIGSKASGAGNLISGNTGPGILISSDDQPNFAANTAVEGNIIGGDASGAPTLGNGGSGIQIDRTTGNKIGGTSPGSSNLITANGGDGVSITGSVAGKNSLHGNAIYGNAGLGIDLNDDGVTANDPGDGDGGPNGLQNFPLLTALDGGSVSGTLTGSANTTFWLDFYASAGCDPSGYGEGEQFLGSLLSVTTDASGSASFTFPFTPVVGKPYLTATATSATSTTGAAGDTSEFSACRALLTADMDLLVTPSEATYGNPVKITVQVSSADGSGPIPTGQVQLKDGSANLGAPLTLDAGKASFSTSALAPGTHALTAQYLGDATYAARSAGPRPVTVKPLALTVTGITASSKVYDGTTTAALDTTGAALVGVINNEKVSLNVSGAAGAFADKNVGQNKPVTIQGLTLTGADAAHYTLTQPGAAAGISPRLLEVTLDNQRKVYGAPLPELTITYANFAPGDSPASLIHPPLPTTAAAATSPVGDYPIVTTLGLPEPNYIYGITNGTLTILPAYTEIHFSIEPAHPHPGQSVTITAQVNAITPGAGTPTGAVVIQLHGKPDVSVPLVPNSTGGSKAVYITSFDVAGMDTIQAVYEGDGNFASSTNSIEIAVTDPGRSYFYLPIIKK